MASLLGGHLDVLGDPGLGPVVLSGKIRVRGTLTDQRLKRFPNVPTIKEVGYDMAVYSLLGLVSPKGMGPAVVSRIHAAFRRAASDPVT